jgi:hypothetical protein
MVARRAGAGMDFGDIGDVLGSATDLLDTGGKFLKAVREVKSQWQQLQSGGAPPGGGTQPGGGAQPSWGAPQPNWGGAYPAAPSYSNAGPSVAAEVRQVAAANGNPWVPETTAGFGGIDLTGVWCPPMNTFDRCVIRQSAAYLNVAAMMGGMMTFAGEGLFDPNARALAFAGRYANGAPAQVRAQLLPNGMINGVLAVQNPWGAAMTSPLFLQRVQ